MIKNLFLAFLILIFFPGLIFAKSKVVNKADGVEVRVESDGPGTIIVENNNGKVKIKTSYGITPTIFISDKKITPTIVTLSTREELDKERPRRPEDFNWLKNIFSSILNFFFKP